MPSTKVGTLKVLSSVPLSCQSRAHISKTVRLVFTLVTIR